MLDFLTNEHWNILEECYCDQRTQEDRKALGQYFTPYIVARFMAEIALEKNPTKVLDPAIGQGIFPAVMSALAPDKNFSFDGFEIDPVVIAYSKQQFPKDLNLINQDFLASSPNEKYDCVIANPPYTIYKSQPVPGNLLKEYSEIIGAKLSPMTNIYNIFVLKALGLLEKNGRAVFIVPSEFLGTDYGISLKSYFLKKKVLSRIVFFDHNNTIFKSGISSACILVFDNCKNEQVLFQLASVSNGSTPEINLSLEKSIGIAELDPVAKWYNLLGKVDSITPPKHKLVEFVRAKRGLATGDNDYFLFNKEKAELFGVESSYLRPCISKAPQVSGYKVSTSDYKALVEKNEKVYVLDISEQDVNANENVKAFIESGISAKIHEKYLPSHRTPWFSTEKRNVPQLFVSTFTRDRVKFILNEAQISHLTCYHGISLLKGDLDWNLIKAMAAYLNSDFCHTLISSQKRRLGGGLSKLEPRDVERIPSPDWSSASKEIILELAKTFDKFSDGIITTEELSDRVVDELDLNSVSASSF